MKETNGHSKNRTVPVSNGKPSYAEKHNIADHFIGGNKLQNAPQSKVRDFVASHDGHTVITNVSASTGPQRGAARGSRGANGTNQSSLAGSDRQQRYRSREGDSVGAEMGLRNLRG